MGLFSFFGKKSLDWINPDEVKEYVIEHFYPNKKDEAIKYYMDVYRCDYDEANNSITDIFVCAKVDAEMLTPSDSMVRDANRLANYFMKVSEIHMISIVLADLQVDISDKETKISKVPQADELFSRAFDKYQENEKLFKKVCRLELVTKEAYEDIVVTTCLYDYLHNGDSANLDEAIDRFEQLMSEGKIINKKLASNIMDMVEVTNQKTLADLLLELNNNIDLCDCLTGKNESIKRAEIEKYFNYFSSKIDEFDKWIKDNL